MERPSAGTHCAAVPGIKKRALVVGQKWPKEWLVAIWLLLALPGASASESWREVLAGMPLRQETRQLNRTNCMELLLSGLQSNAVVKALIFMPGATDEFYMYRRAEAQLTNVSPSLLQAIDALTSQTRIRATFRSPMLLLHTDQD